MIFTPTARVVKCDDRGRVNIGKVDASAKGQTFEVYAGENGTFMLKPVEEGAE